MSLPNRFAMTDPYAPCGCGSGKKFKFCCKTPPAMLPPLEPPVPLLARMKAVIDELAGTAAEEKKAGHDEAACNYATAAELVRQVCVKYCEEMAAWRKTPGANGKATDSNGAGETPALPDTPPSSNP